MYNHPTLIYMFSLYYFFEKYLNSICTTFSEKTNIFKTQLVHNMRFEKFDLYHFLARMRYVFDKEQNNENLFFI